MLVKSLAPEGSISASIPDVQSYSTPGVELLILRCQIVNRENDGDKKKPGSREREETIFKNVSNQPKRNQTILIRGVLAGETSNEE